MKEDAVSPVIGAMLLLAVGVTFFAAWNAYYVPSMKTQSEISHIRDVESGFLRFSSDIGTAVLLKRNMRLSEPLPLGGGDFIFDPVKSGGELQVRNSSTHDYIMMNWTDGTNTESPDHVFGIARFWYKSAGNFWQDQGYGWSYGTVYVMNSERNISTPLHYAARDDITGDIAGSLFTLETLPAYASPGNCSSITVGAVTIGPDARQRKRHAGAGKRDRDRAGSRCHRSEYSYQPSSAGPVQLNIVELRSLAGTGIACPMRECNPDPFYGSRSVPAEVRNLPLSEHDPEGKIHPDNGWCVLTGPGERKCHPLSRNPRQSIECNGAFLYCVQGIIRHRGFG